MLAVFSGQAAASAVTYSGTSGNLSASVTFSLTGNTLAVDMSQMSPNDVTEPQGVLRAVFFNTSHVLTPMSASLDGSSVFYGSLSNVGDGWAYYSNLAGGGDEKTTPSLLMGFGIGTGHSNFSSHPNSLGGIDYGVEYKRQSLDR